MIAVLGDRLRVKRQGPLVVALSLFLCVAVGGFSFSLAARGGATTPTPGLPAAEANVAAVPTATSAPPAPTATAESAPASGAAATAPPRTATQAPASAPALMPVAATSAQPTATAEVTATLPATSPTPVPPTPRGTTVIPILMYHYVRVVADKSDTVGINLSVTPLLFAAQMKHLAENGYTTLTMGDVYAILAGTQPLPPKPIALTFDDGYRDFYTAAWPILKQYNLKATNYVITSVIGNEQYMTWAMLQELDATGQIEIGAHTRTHPDLRSLSKDKRWDEIVGSKAILEQGLGHPIGAFCYPSGFYNDAVVADVKRAGYLTATTVDYGTKQNIREPYTMPRIRVNGPDTLATWIGKLP